MVRKLSLMLVLTLGLVPLAAQALGLGNIKLNSALNQRFNAEIGLMSLAKGEIHDVKVTMASDEAYKRSGIDRTFLLTTLKFKPEQKADGTAVIKVTSDNPIQEPFLNFLIEVNWPKGRLIREYTVLLDPPATLERKPAPIKAPEVAAKPAVSATPVKSAPAIEPPPVAEPSGDAGVDEVKVASNESLWIIARKHQHAGVDHTRMMMAIYSANKQAFINSNINRLKKGAILRIPDKKSVLALDVRQAQIDYKRHIEEWQADPVVSEPEAPQATEDEGVDAKPEAKDSEQATEQQAKTEEEPKAEEPKAEEGDKAEGEKKAPVTEESKKEAEQQQDAKSKEEKAASEAELKIATARPEGKGEAGPSEDDPTEETIAKLKQELLLLEENAESVRGENEELTSRIVDLEAQLKDLEGILEQVIQVKDSQMAELQAAIAKSKQAQQLQADSASQQEAKPEAEAAAQEPKAEVKPEAEAAAEEPKAEVKPEAEAAAQEPKAEAKPQEVQPESVVKPLSGSEKKPGKAATATVEDEPEQGLFSTIVSSPTLLGITLAVIMVLVGLVWMLISRKSASTPDFQESILLNTIDEEEESSTLDEANNIPAHTEETSFLSDFSPSDIDALQDETGEVDPLSEADVYIAYGRYQQAEELIRQAIDKEPSRDALKHKLFEILYATKDADSFVSLVDEVAGTTVETSDGEAWQKVMSMGKMLQPEHPKFVDAQDIESDDDLFSLDDDLLEDDLSESDFADLDETLTQAEFGVESDEKAADDVVKTDDTVDELDDLDFESDMDDSFITSAIDELEELDDSLSDSSKDAEAELPEAVDGDDEEFTLDLSDLEDEGEKTILSLQDELDAEEDAESESLGELDDLDAASFSEDEMLASELEETSLDIPDMEPQEGDSELVSLGELDVDLSLSDDTPDEIATKLDLARAYVDMGDKDGASDILDEVLSEGDAAQKEEAQKIKDSIS